MQHRAGPAGRHAGPDRGHPRDAGAEETLAESFVAVARQLRGMSQEALAPWEINPSQLRAMRVLSHHGTLRLSQLSERLHIAPRSATEVVDQLQSRGLVRRRPDPDDRRATLVEVTYEGAELLGALRAARGAETERIFERLSPADQEQLARILRELRDRLRDPGGAPN